MDFRGQPVFHCINNQPIRVVEREDGPWFVAADVCKALGYKNPSEFVKPLDSRDKAKNFLGFGRPATVVSEAGLYQVLLRTQRTKPQARAFQDWVTRDVLPAIRKDGAYVMGEEKVATGEMSEDELIGKAMEVMQNKLKCLELEKEQPSVTVWARKADSFIQ